MAQIRWLFASRTQLRHRQHWVAVFWLDGEAGGEFFDSYAVKPHLYQSAWQCFDAFQQSPRALQQWTTDVCGDYALYYLYFSPGNLLYDTAVVRCMHELFLSLTAEKHTAGWLLDAGGRAQVCIERERHHCYNCSREGACFRSADEEKFFFGYKKECTPEELPHKKNFFVDPQREEEGGRRWRR